MKEKLQKLIEQYGISKQTGIFAWALSVIVSLLTGYNHNKYWRRREYVVDVTKKNIIKKLFFIYYLKKVDAKKLSSTGFSYNAGSQFFAPPPYCLMVLIG